VVIGGGDPFGGVRVAAHRLSHQDALAHARAQLEVVGRLEQQHHGRAQLELAEQLTLGHGDALLHGAQVGVLVALLVARPARLVGAQLLVAVDADRAHVGRAHRRQREKAVLPRAHVHSALVQAEQVGDQTGHHRVHAQQLTLRGKSGWTSENRFNWNELVLVRIILTVLHMDGILRLFLYKKYIFSGCF
jgi:hypothetical protein